MGSGMVNHENPRVTGDSIYRSEGTEISFLTGHSNGCGFDTVLSLSVSHSIDTTCSQLVASPDRKYVPIGGRRCLIQKHSPSSFPFSMKV